MEPEELARIAALLEQIRDNQSEQLARQREALEFQKSQLELVRRQSERAEKIQDRAEELQARGAEALAVLEKGLTGRRWLVGENATLADIALFAYTHVADEAGYHFADFPAIVAWVAEFKRLPWYSPITAP